MNPTFEQLKAEAKKRGLVPGVSVDTPYHGTITLPGYPYWKWDEYECGSRLYVLVNPEDIVGAWVYFQGVWVTLTPPKEEQPARVDPPEAALLARFRVWAAGHGLFPGDEVTWFNGCRTIVPPYADWTIDAFTGDLWGGEPWGMFTHRLYSMEGKQWVGWIKDDRPYWARLNNPKSTPTPTISKDIVDTYTDVAVHAIAQIIGHVSPVIAGRKWLRKEVDAIVLRLLEGGDKSIQQ